MNQSSSTNPMEFFQQFSQLMFLQQLAAARKMSPLSQMNSGMLGFLQNQQHQQQKQQQQASPMMAMPASPTQAASSLPPTSPSNAASTSFQTIADVLASHQAYKSQLASPASPSDISSQFKMYNDYGSNNNIQHRQYKVHVNRESAKPLQAWMDQHINDPYPTTRDVAKLSQETGFTHKQIRNWFTNSRRRYEQTCGNQPLPWNKKDAPKVCRKEFKSETSETS